MGQVDTTENFTQSLNVNYLGHGLIRPGLQIGYRHTLVRFDPEEPGKRALLLNPQLGFYGRRNFYSAVFTNVQLRFEQHFDDAKFSWAAAIGVGYLHRLEVLALTVDLQGKITERRHETRPYFYPNATVGWAHKLGHRTEFTNDFNLGVQLSSTRESAGNLFVVLGLRYYLDPTPKPEVYP